MHRGKGPYIVSSAAIIALSLTFFGGFAAPCHSQVIEPNQLSQLEYRYIGPPGNRVTSVVGIPGNHITYCTSSDQLGQIGSPINGHTP
jgi:hypothetical protein